MNAHRVSLPLVLAAALTLIATPMHASEAVVGDANGDGAVDLDDLRVVEYSVENGQPASGPDALTDVAEPCDRALDGADVARLKKALDGFELGLGVASRCHGTDIGSPLPASPPPAPETLDDVFVAIAAEVPEFGGLYIDAEGVPTMVLTDLGAWADAEAAVFARFNPERLGAEVLGAVAGKFGFGDLHEYRIVARDLLGLPGVLGLDACEVRNRLVVGVESAAAGDLAADALATVGVPAGAALVEVDRAVRKLFSPAASPADARRHRARPLHPGGRSSNAAAFGVF